MSAVLHQIREQYVHLHMVRAGLDAGRRWDAEQAELQCREPAPRGYRLDEIPELDDSSQEGNTPKGDQPRFERGREGMEPEACESAAGRGTAGAPALVTLPHISSPVGGPMGAGYPAAAGPAGGEC